MPLKLFFKMSRGGLLRDSLRLYDVLRARNLEQADENRFLSGFEDEFVHPVDADFICPICKWALRSPILTSCGHRFCKGCIDELCKRENVNTSFYGLLELKVSCPVDRTKLSREKDIFADKFTERKILSLVIKCPNKDCKWTGELKEKESHREWCPSEVVECHLKNCTETIARKNLDDHVTNTCQWRELHCEHCSMSHPACHQSDHQLECKRFPVNCPNGCRKTIPREEIETHTDSDCPKTIVSCPFSDMDCQTKVRRSELGSHIQAATNDHLDLACVKLRDLEETHEELEAKTEELKEKYDNIIKEHQELKETTRKLEEMLNYAVHVLTTRPDNREQQQWQSKHTTWFLP